VGIDGLTLTKLRSVGDDEKTIPSCSDIRCLMIAPPILLQNAFCALKNTDRLKLDRFKFLVLDIFSARRVSAELQLESQSEPMGSFGIKLNFFDRILELNRWGSLEFNSTFSIGFWNGLLAAQSDDVQKHTKLKMHLKTQCTAKLGTDLAT
jgi:hypothetical protein